MPRESGHHLAEERKRGLTQAQLAPGSASRIRALGLSLSSSP